MRLLCRHLPVFTVDEIQQALGNAAEKLQNIEEPKVDPTITDWEETILPSIHNYLTVDNMEPWQIDEWMRSIRLKLSECIPQNFKPCLEFIADNLFQEGEPPPNIRKFFQKPQPYYIRRQQSQWKYPKGATESAKRRLEKEFKNMSSINVKTHGFVAKPIRNNLFHWTISLFDFDRHSSIHQELVHFTLKNDPENPSIVSDTGMVNAVDILFEVKFPVNYPNGSPLFRLIRPRFLNLDEGLFDFDFSTVPKDDEDGSDIEEEGDTIHSNSLSTNGPSFPITTTTTTTTNTSTPTPENFTYTTTPTTKPVIQEPVLSPSTASTAATKPVGFGTMSTLETPHSRLPHPMSVSMNLEKQDWKKMPKIFDFAVHLRQNILNSNYIHIDINSSKEGIPTEGSFWQEYKCLSLSDIDHRPESDVGGKIYLPPGSLSEIMDTDRYGSYGFAVRDRGRGSPMIFEISSKSGLRSFCGVLEFIAPEGCVGVPSWMMEHLGLSKEQPVQIRKVHLPKGIYVKLQPHTGEFNKTQDIRATLEWVLRRFVALSVGDTIEVEHDHVRLKFNVLECTPDRAIAITDQDVSVDFVTALDGKEIKTQNQEIENEENMNIISDSVTVGQMNPQGIEGVDYNLCPNCHQSVPPSSITMHVMRCERINWYCDICKIVVLKTDTEAHNEKFHTQVICEECGDTMEKRLISDHKKSSCPLRFVSCQFCKLKMQYRKVWSHEQSCGSVTELCSKCNNRYPRREQESHSQSCSTTTTKAPPPYREYRIPPRIPKPSNDLMLCEKCSSPFSTFDELQVHILTSHVEELHDFPGLFGGYTELKNSDSEKGESGTFGGSTGAVGGDSGEVKGDSTVVGENTGAVGEDSSKVKGDSSPGVIQGDPSVVTGNPGDGKEDSGVVRGATSTGEVMEDASMNSQETDMVDVVDADNANKVGSINSGTELSPKPVVMEPLPLPTRIQQWEGNLTGKEKKKRKAPELEDFEVEVASSDDE